MSRLLDAKNIAERALRKIGSFSINDESADPAEMEETLFWMDMVVSELAGTRRAFWLVPATITFPLAANVASYKLSQVLGAGSPNDYQFPIEAWIRDTNGEDTRIDLLRRTEYEARPDKAETGKPTGVYIDRTQSPVVLLDHVPVDGSYTLRLEVQQQAPDLTERLGARSHGFATEWQKWLTVATAAEIADGPVRRLPFNEVDRMKQQANSSLTALLAYSNKERVGPRRTKAWGA